jgi:hypothetical protein
MRLPKVKLISTLGDIAITPKIERAGDFKGKYFVLLAPLAVEIDGALYVVPKGFITDLGSIPKWFRRYADISDESTLGFIIHDWLYGDTRTRHDIPRHHADLVLLDIITQCGQNFIERWLVYLAVACFGWISYRRPKAKLTQISGRLIYNIINGTHLTKYDYADIAKANVE